MERRKTPRKDWVISKDDVGRAVLEWKVDPLRAKRMESDPCARTYDFLNRLSSPDLTLEEEAAKRDHGAHVQPVRSRAAAPPNENIFGLSGRRDLSRRSVRQKENPRPFDRGFCIKSLAMTYSRVG